MGVFETEANLSLEAFTDFEIDKMIEELKDEKERRYTFRRVEAIDEILEVMHKHYDALGDVWFSVYDNSDFCLDTLMIAFENYRKGL